MGHCQVVKHTWLESRKNEGRAEKQQQRNNGWKSDTLMKIMRNPRNSSPRRNTKGKTPKHTTLLKKNKKQKTWKLIKRKTLSIQGKRPYYSNRYTDKNESRLLIRNHVELKKKKEITQDKNK